MKNLIRYAAVLVPLCAAASPMACAAPSEEQSISQPATISQGDSTMTDDTPREDLLNESAHPWQRYEVVDEHHVRVFVTMGTETCYGLRAEVQETNNAIAIATITGTLPEAPMGCTRELREASLLVETQQPVGERPVTHLNHPHVRS